MAGLDAEANALSVTLGRAGEAQAGYERQAQQTGQSVDELRAKHEGLIQRLHEQGAATEALREAEGELNEALLRVDTTSEELGEHTNTVASQRQHLADVTRDVAQAEAAFRDELGRSNEEFTRSSQLQLSAILRRDSAYQDEIKSARAAQRANEEASAATKKAREDELKGFLDSDDAVKKFSASYNDLVKTIKSNDLGQLIKIGSLNQVMQQFIGALNTIKGIAQTGLVIGSAAGGIGLFGAGGVEGIAAMVASMSELVGVIGLLPGALGGAGVALGTLLVGLHGIPEALSSMGNIQKFVQSIYYLAPAAKEAMITLQSFYSSFRGAMNMVQEQMFEPLVNDIRPLVETLLPQLMHWGMDIARVFGEAGHLFVTWLEAPSTIQAISGFVHNLADGLRAALPGLQAFGQAMLTMSSIGSGFFVELANSFTRVAQEFNAFISSTQGAKVFQEFIQTGIQAWGVLLHNMLAVGQALMNIFTIGNQFGGGFLSLFKDIGDEFLRWTQSAGGQSSIADFFQTLTTLGRELHPILTTISHALGGVFSTLGKMGEALAPAIGTFFTDLAQALQILEPALIASAPAFSIFITAMGQLILNIAQAIGPNLPQFLMSFAEAAQRLVGPATTLAVALANLLGKLTPDEVKWIGIAVIGFEALSVVVPIVAAAVALLIDPITWVVAAVAALVAGLIYAYNHLDWFREGLDQIGNEITKLPGQISHIGDIIARFFENLWNDAYNWGHNLIQNFIHGIESMYNSLTNVVSNVAATVERFLGIHSPAAEGPLSEDSSVWGSNLVTGFASGMNSASGSVGSAAGNVAGQASGGLQGASGGQIQGTTAGIGGGVTTYNNTFSAWVKHLTDGLSQWSKIFHEAFDVGLNIFKMAMTTIDLTARLWNGGVNKLTAPGGFDQGAKPLIPGVGLPGQQPVPGVPQVGMGGKFTAPGQPAIGVSQPQVPGAPGPGGPGIPQASQGGPSGRGSDGGQGVDSGQVDIGFDGQPITQTSAAVGPMPAGVRQNANGSYSMNAAPNQIASFIIAGGRARGMTDQQIRAALTVAQGESAMGTNAYGGDQGIGGAWGVYQQGNAYGPVSNRQDPNAAINAFLDLYSGQLKAQPGLSPEQVAVGVQQHGGPGSPGRWQNTGGDNTYYGQIFTQQNQSAVNGYMGNAQQPQVALRDQSTPLGNASGDVGFDGTAIPGSGGWSANPGSQATRVAQYLGAGNGSTTGAVDAARNAGAFTSPPIYRPGTNSGGYGHTDGLPQWAIELGAQFGLVPSTYPEGGTLHQEGYAMDFAAAPGNKDPAGSQDRFAQYIMDNFGPQTLELVHANSRTGQHWGMAGGRPVGPGTNMPGYFSDDWTGHDDYGPEPHVHWATDTAPLVGGQPIPGQPIPVDIVNQGGKPLAPPSNTQTPAPTPTAPAPPSPAPGPSIEAQPGESPDRPLSQQRRQQLGIPDSVPPVYPSAPGGPSRSVAAVPGSAAPTLQPGQPNLTTPDQFYAPGATASGDVPQGAGPSSSISGFQMATQIGSAVGNIAGSIFQTIDSFIQSIGAAADIVNQTVHLTNSEGIVKMVGDIQQFIKTGAQVAQTVSQVTGAIGSLVGAAAAADPTGGAGAAAGGIQAASMIAGLVSDALSTINEGISLGIDIYHQIGKVTAELGGFTLGGSATGWLGGNVQMLLNTETGQMYTYNDSNPYNKNVLNPGFRQAYAQGTGSQQVSYVQQNIYAGPGQSTQQMMGDSMWMIQTASPSVASVAGKT